MREKRQHAHMALLLMICRKVKLKKNMTRMKNTYDENEAACIYGTPPDDMEEGVSEKK